MELMALLLERQAIAAETVVVACARNASAAAASATIKPREISCWTCSANGSQGF
jgi:phosphosulfolactate phosphohydrolase-like enzyme